MFGSAFFPKELALRGLQNALQYFSALCGFWIGHPGFRHRVALLRVPWRVLLANAKRRLRDESEAAPFEVGTQLEDLRHGLEGGAVAFPWDHSLVLVLDAGFAGLE